MWRGLGPRGGFTDLDEEDAVLDARRLFEKRGVDVVAGGAAVRQLVLESKAFFAEAPVLVDPPDLKVVEGEVPVKDPDSDEDETAEFVIALACQGEQGNASSSWGVLACSSVVLSVL